jgi:hypothetical protein
MKDLYGILGVAPDATPEQLREAYRRLAFTWHPDRNHHRPEEAHERFLDLGEAYGILRDPTSRVRYDALRRATVPLPPRSRPAAPPPRKGWYDLEEEILPEEPEPEPEPVPTPSDHRARTLQGYRERVRRLARDLATSDRWGRRLDRFMVVLTTVAFLSALGSTILLLLGPQVPELAPTIWIVILAWMTTATSLAWMVSFRERGVAGFWRFAEEILLRTGRGWSPAEGDDFSTDR